jgi:hypothetical protein
MANLKYFCETQVHKRYGVPPWLSPVERLAVNQLVIGSNPIGGAFTVFCYGSTTSVLYPIGFPMTQSVIVDFGACLVHGNVRLIWRLSPLFRLHLTGSAASTVVPFK